MMRRFSSTFKKSKGDNTPKENCIQANGKHTSKASPRSSPEEEHNVKRNEVSATFEKYAQLIHASRRPVPTQSGDGTYLETESSSGLFQDLKALGFKDVTTLKDVMRNKAKGEYVDDKTMLMERIIQV